MKSVLKHEKIESTSVNIELIIKWNLKNDSVIKYRINYNY